MKHIAEKNRKFTDMIDLKIHHSIFPVKCPPADASWSQIFRFDEKVIVPGKSDIQNITDRGILIALVMIGGTAAYSDSTGYKKILEERDTLLIGLGNQDVQSVVFNFNTTEETEFLEIWLTTDSLDKTRSFFGAAQNQIPHTPSPFLIPALDADSIDLNSNSWLSRDRFAADSKHSIGFDSLNDKLLLFVLSGSMTVNDLVMSYRDGLIISLTDTVNIHFNKDTDLLMIQLPENTENRGSAK